MGGLKALLMLHSPLLHLQALDELWMCLRREVSQGGRDRMEAGDGLGLDLMILEVFPNLRNSLMVPGRSRESAKTETAAKNLQVVPE